MLACDFLTVETVLFTRIYVLFFVSLDRRRVEFVASTANPDGRWVAQQARNLIVQLGDQRLCASSISSAIATASSPSPSTTSSAAKASGS